MTSPFVISSWRRTLALRMHFERKMAVYSHAGDNRDFFAFSKKSEEEEKHSSYVFLVVIILYYE